MLKSGSLDRSPPTCWSRFWHLWWQSPAPSVLPWILLMLIWPLWLAGCSLPVTSSSPSSPAKGQGYRLQCRPTVGLTFRPSTYITPPALTGLEAQVQRVERVNVGLKCSFLSQE